MEEERKTLEITHDILEMFSHNHVEHQFPISQLEPMNVEEMRRFNRQQPTKNAPVVSPIHTSWGRVDKFLGKGVQGHVYAISFPASFVAEEHRKYGIPVPTKCALKSTPVVDPAQVLLLLSLLPNNIRQQWHKGEFNFQGLLDRAFGYAKELQEATPLRKEIIRHAGMITKRYSDLLHNPAYVEALVGWHASQLVLAGISPNFLTLYATYRATQVVDLKGGHRVRIPIQVALIEYVDGMTLMDWFQDNLLDYAQPMDKNHVHYLYSMILSIATQTALTLIEGREAIDFRHHDMHLANMMLSMPKEQGGVQFLHCWFGNKVVRIRVSGLAVLKILDYGWTSATLPKLLVQASSTEQSTVYPSNYPIQCDVEYCDFAWSYFLLDVFGILAATRSKWSGVSKTMDKFVRDMMELVVRRDSKILENYIHEKTESRVKKAMDWRNDVQSPEEFLTTMLPESMIMDPDRLYMGTFVWGQ